MLDMLSERKVETTDLPKHLLRLVEAAQAAAEAFRAMDYAMHELRDFPAPLRMPIERAVTLQWEAWQEMERRGGALINDYRMRQLEKDAAN